MGADGVVVARLAAKFAEFRPHVDERRWRLYLGSEARAHAEAGGCSLAAAAAVVAAAAGVSRATVMAGAGELAEGAQAMAGRSRRPGAGRPPAEEVQPGLREALLELAEASARGDPVAELTWCSRSLRELARELAARGFRCGKDAAARVLRAEGYSLQGMAKVLEGRQHPDRDEQFRRINAAVAGFRAAGDPVVSVDAKKKELVGLYGRPGRTWQPAGSPVQVRDHDFPDPELGKIAPYGIYDIAANTGFVSVGVSRDTAAFAVNALRLWWRREGSLRYRGAGRLLVVCDAGGSNGYRCHLWKDQLAELAAETGLEITVCHFPPGTSKWNKIEHRLFCHVTRTWAARPLMSAEDAVAGIAATVTGQGLKCTAVLDDAGYPGGVEVSSQRMRYLEERVLDRDPFHGEWNYTVLPAPRPGPGPGTEPGTGTGPAPDLEGLASLAGIGDLGALLEAVAAPWAAAREQRLYLDRGRARRKATGGGPKKLQLDAIMTAAACRLRLGMPYQLLAEVPGVPRSTLSLPASRAVPLLEQHGITPQRDAPPITTLAELHDHARTAGITLTAHADTPETAN